MNTIQELFQQAQLAEATYADFLSNTGSLLTNDSDVKDALQDQNNNMIFSDAQVAAFVSHWTVANQLPDTTSSGFSGTLFQNKTSGQYSLAMRCTAGATDLMADAGDVLVDGIAQDQVRRAWLRAIRLPLAETWPIATERMTRWPAFRGKRRRM